MQAALGAAHCIAAVFPDRRGGHGRPLRVGGGTTHGLRLQAALTAGNIRDGGVTRSQHGRRAAAVVSDRRHDREFLSRSRRLMNQVSGVFTRKSRRRPAQSRYAAAARAGRLVSRLVIGAARRRCHPASCKPVGLAWDRPSRRAIAPGETAGTP